MDKKQELERQIEELKEESQEKEKSRLEKLKDWIKRRNGLATAKGKYLDKSEIHAIALGVSPIGLAYILPTPVGELFILMLLGWMRIASKKWFHGENLHGHLGDVAHEMAYTVSFAFLTAIFFHYRTGFSLSSVDLQRVVTMLLVGG